MGSYSSEEEQSMYDTALANWVVDKQSNYSRKDMTKV